MTQHEAAAVTVALAYHDAWTAQDLDRAMSYVADEIVCAAPAGRIEGITRYREFLANFAEQLNGVEMVAAFGDDDTALLMYYPHTAAVTDALTAECFTVSDGKIVRSLLVFDRPSFAPPTATR